MLRRYEGPGLPAGPTPNAIRLACTDCSLRAHCLPPDLSEAELAEVENLVGHDLRIPRGGTLFHAGQKFEALYAIKSGFYKTVLTTADGRQQITGFHMGGDMLGLHGISVGHYIYDAIALEDATACRLPYQRLQTLAQRLPALQIHLNHAMSRQIADQHGVMLLLGNMRADERVAAFLLNLLQRLAARGYSDTEMLMRMTREEIGSYLGLTLETVSRIFSRFAADGLIAVANKHVRVLRWEALEALVHLPGCDPAA